MTKPFYYKKSDLYGEEVTLASIAKEFGTPCYVYSKAALESNFEAFTESLHELPHQICYAVKANSNLAILNIFAKMNAGFDIVSMGECERVLAAKGNPKKIAKSARAAIELLLWTSAGPDARERRDHRASSPGPAVGRGDPPGGRDRSP